jgi:hypothetical protein
VRAAGVDAPDLRASRLERKPSERRDEERAVFADEDARGDGIGLGTERLRIRVLDRRKADEHTRRRPLDAEISQITFMPASTT